MRISSFALLFVVFLDIMSQGLVIPILVTILLDPAQGFLPAHTTTTERQFDFGVVMGVFFLSWFLGAAYISRLSDFIGRKEGILICLSGNLLGYGLTIVALLTDSLALLIVARAISGFTAGNQPIAQAALIDISTSEAQKTRFLGLVLAALSAGLVVGPLLGGFLSDKAVLGPLASVELPFYAVSALVVFNIVLIIAFFHDKRPGKRPIKVRPVEVFLTLYQAARRPVVMKLSLVFFFGQLAANTYFIFMSDYFSSRFAFDTLENAIALAVLGASTGLTSTFLIGPVGKRFSKKGAVAICLAGMGVSAVAAIFNPSPLIAYVLLIPLSISFGVYYPTAMTMFSNAVDAGEQGWVMGVTVALYTLGAGLISLIGGPLIAIDARLPFFIAAAAAFVALTLLLLLWRGNAMQALDRR